MGMEQDYTKPGIAIFSQAKFIRRIEDCPIPKGAKADDLADAATITAYRGTLGAMQYAKLTKPSFAYAFSDAAQKTGSLRIAHVRELNETLGQLREC